MSTMWQGCLPDTDYFEIRSGEGHDYGIWVTRPPGHDPAAAPTPVVYVLDGNYAVGLTTPLIVTQADPMQRIRPYTQVSVGYARDDAQNWAWLRNRDLVPPGEPVAAEMLDAIDMGVQTGAMTREHADAYLAELRSPRADAFLSFLIDELHPRIEDDYNTAANGHGLFGYSYGGLFALYAWLTAGSLFDSVGAGSPGVLSEDSPLIDQLENIGAHPTAARLHLTVNDRELFGDIPAYRTLARNTARVMHSLSARGADVSGEVLRDTHVTGLQASFLSYLRSCRVA